MNRKDKALRHINKNGRGIEIGPSHNPLAPKKDGYKVHIIDHMSREQLIAKYKDHHVNLENIEEVDFVWRGENISELTRKAKYYDWIVASHVIEHTPNLIGFLNGCDTILKDDGVVSLVILDKRYCFDRYRPITGISKIIDSHFQENKIHTPGTVAEYFLNVVSKAGSIAWNSRVVGEYDFVHSLEDAIRGMEEVLNEKAYLDVHAWCFTPHSFRLIIHDLFCLGFIALQEVEFFPTEGCEFHIILGRNGQGINKSRLEILDTIDAEISYQSQESAMNILNEYVNCSPSNKSILDIFAEEWSSAMPTNSGLTTIPGKAGLFEDDRVIWAQQTLGPFEDLTVIELGPLECGHSYMLQQMRARKIIAVEANTRAFLKCLCIKEVFDLDKVELRLGDFVRFLAEMDFRVDLVFASGVLYHMTEPVKVLELIAERTDRLFLWTHYYDHDIISNNPNLKNKYGELTEFKYAGEYYQSAKQNYQAALKWAGFCGGSQSWSTWLTRDSILKSLRTFGFTQIQVGFDDLEHPNGPAFALCASR